MPIDRIGRNDKLELASRNAYLRAHGFNPHGPLQLQIWPDDVREMPNDYARSALFTVRNKTEPRALMQGSLLFHVEKAVRITFTGIELRADDDELVWQQILEYAKRLNLGDPVEFNLHSLCRDLNWSVNGRNYDKARRCISRLKASEVKVENESRGRGVAMSLIREYEYEGEGDKGTKYRVWIHPNLIMLFAGKASTRITWAKYRDLTPIARRLYDYFASWRNPFPLRVDTFYKVCASSCGDASKWRSMVRRACKELVEADMVRGWRALELACISYGVEGDRVIWRQGVFSRATGSMEFFRVQNVEMTQTFFQRIAGVGNVALVTQDRTNQLVVMLGMKRPEQLRDRINEYVMQQRRLRGFQEVVVN